MKKIWEGLSIVYKLFAALGGTIALIILILLVYLGGHESSLLLEKEKENLHNRSLGVAGALGDHLLRLQKEVAFLTRLEVMDDIVVRDMDRRITVLLEQKADDLGESVKLIVAGVDGKVCAASEQNRTDKRFSDMELLSAAVQKGRTYFFQGRELYLFAPVYGSFYTHELLGYVILYYPLANLDVRIKSADSHSRWLKPPVSLPVHYPSNVPLGDRESYLVDATALSGVLAGWTLYSALPKHEALAMVYHFQTVILVVFGIGIAAIMIMVWIILMRISKPLRELSDTAMEIALTGDYSRTVPESGSDEIGTMAYSFNALMYSTLVAIKRLEIEREKHADKLVSLIVFFNAITRTETKEETIRIAIDEIRRFSNAGNVYFDSESGAEEEDAIYLKLSGNDSAGRIRIDNPELTKESNERFYDALERMVSLQIERIELLEKTQAAVKAKSVFLSTMSHELRTPLGSILSLTQYLMTQRSTPAPTAESLAKIEYSAQYLLSVINNILDLAKAEAGKMEPVITACNPVELIESAVDLVLPLIEDKELNLTADFTAVEAPFHTDEHLFGQVVMNLLSNAVKYTEKGGIALTLQSLGGYYVFEVRDTGCGIGADALAHLFDEFYQVRRSDRERIDGTGLGLSLSKRIAQVLGGDVEVTSEGEGKGTVAKFLFSTL